MGMFTQVNFEFPVLIENKEDIDPSKNSEFWICRNANHIWDRINIKDGKLRCKSLEFKNYDSEVHHFIEMVLPFVRSRRKRQYLGYFEYDGQSDVTRVFCNCSKPERSWNFHDTADSH